MDVFKGVAEQYGGPIALSAYLDPHVRASPTAAHSSVAPAISASDSYIDRKSFYDAVLSDSDFSIVTAFLLGGVPVSAARSLDGATALHVAVAHSTRPLSELLHRRQHQRNTTAGASGFAPLDDGADGGSSGSAETQAEDEQRAVLGDRCVNRLVISFLIDNGADVNAQASVGGETPLMVACATQNIAAVKLLLAKGAATHALDFDGRSCLHYAALHPCMLQVLMVWLGAPAMAQLARETGLLQWVCRTPGTRFSALFLLEQLGLDVNAADCLASASPAISPREQSRTDEAIAKRDAGDGRVSIASGSRAGPNEDTTVTREMAPLECAVEAGDLALVITLLTKGATVPAGDVGAGVREAARTGADSALAHCCHVHRQLCFLHARLSAPRWLTGPFLRWYVRTVALASVDVDSAALWGPTMRAVGIQELLTFCASAPAPLRERLLARMENASPSMASTYALSDLAAFRYGLPAVVFALLPQAFMWVVAWLFHNFIVNLLAVVAVFATFIYVKRLDEQASGCRPLRSLGYVVGVLTMQSLCLPIYTTNYFYSYYSFDDQPHRALTWWLVPSAVGSFICLVWIVFVSPGTVASTAGHRRGIYAAIAQSKVVTQTPVASVKGNDDAATAALPVDFLRSVDLVGMVKLPLRAQRSRALGRVVLRYDHYCGYLASAIGARNHRPFFFLHLGLLSLFGSFYYYALGYHEIVYGASARYLERSKMANLSDREREAMALLRDPLFATPYLRFGYMYTQIILPVMLLMVFMELYGQFFAIMRNLTWFDLGHATSESSLYCFTLGETVYSLFDQGYVSNLSSFFGWTGLAQVLYRVPQMSSVLRKTVEEYQRWQVSSAQGGSCGHDHGPHDPHGHSHGGDTGQQQQQQQPPSKAAQPPASSSIINATNDSLLTATAAAAQAYGASQQQQLQSNATTATAAAAGGASSRVGPRMELDTTVYARPEEAQRAQQLYEGAAQRAASASVAAATAPSTDGRQSAESVHELAQYLFAEMLRTGSDDVVDAGTEAGAAADRTQLEWQQAVQQAKAMYAFFTQTMTGAQQSMMRPGGGDDGAPASP